MSLQARREIVRICRRLSARGLIAGGEGNVSVRLGGERVLITPRGRSKAELLPRELVELSLTGAPHRGSGRASTEAAVHLHLYRARADVNAVVHAHPPVATGFAAAGETLPLDALPEVTYGLGPVALVPYERPSTEALAERVAEHAAEHDVFLLANHGAVTVGHSLETAQQRMESLEHAAQIIFVARRLGGVRPLEAAEVAALLAARRDTAGERSA